MRVHSNGTPAAASPTPRLQDAIFAELRFLAAQYQAAAQAMRATKARYAALGDDFDLWFYVADDNLSRVKNSLLSAIMALDPETRDSEVHDMARFMRPARGIVVDDHLYLVSPDPNASYPPGENPNGDDKRHNTHQIYLHVVPLSRVTTVPAE